MRSRSAISRRVFFLAALGGAFVPAAFGAGRHAGDLPAYVPAAHASGTLRFSGASTMHDLVAAWGRGFRFFQPDAVVDNDGNSTLSAQGVAALLAGRADVVTFVREPFPAESTAFVRRFGYPITLVNVAGGSYDTQGGTHAIAIYVNARNPIAHITLAELDAIFSQDRRCNGSEPIVTWGQLGLTADWARQPIHAYGMLHRRESGNPPGIVNFLQQCMLCNGTFRDDIREQVDHPGESALQAIVHRVAADPLGIGYSGFGYAANGAKALALARSSEGPFYAGTPVEVARRDYPLSRQIYLGFARARDGSVPPLLREFIAFVLSEGQRAVAHDRMHFLPLTAAQAAASRRAFDLASGSR